MKKQILSLIILAFTVCSYAQNNPNTEKYRPQIHFTPQSGWMNDPNGMVYTNGEYHLCYQYYPDKTVWGPMHWGHAVSKDLIHWERLPIALYPDTLGYIFSGSAVVDVNNTTGFGKNGKAPLVAIYTYHNMNGERAGRNDFQYQAIAYSNDNGRTWEKYAGNPVVKNPGQRDFRDPKVFWHEATKSWVMALATYDCVTIFSSPDLKNWTKQSEFGKEVGKHGANWECPDLFPLKVKGTNKTKWVMLVSINPGAPFGGSATQYFIGDFDGKIFHNEYESKEARWVDYGKDNYAGVTWSNIPEADGRRLFIGWMSNWQYAERVPTTAWRSATTLPRELTLIPDAKGAQLISFPSKEVESLRNGSSELKPLVLDGVKDISNLGTLAKSPVEIVLTFAVDAKSGKVFGLKLSNNMREEIEIGYDKEKKQLFVDRRKSGVTNFASEFPEITYAPCELENGKIELHLWVDETSIELFGQRGKAVMTNLFFPTKPYTKLSLFSEDGKVEVKGCKVWKLKSIY